MQKQWSDVQLLQALWSVVLELGPRLSSQDYARYRAAHPELRLPDESTLRTRLGGWNQAVNDAFRINYRPQAQQQPQLPEWQRQWEAVKGRWPLTLERLTVALYGDTSDGKEQQARKLLRTWREKGLVHTLARGVYDSPTRTT